MTIVAIQSFRSRHGNHDITTQAGGRLTPVTPMHNTNMGGASATALGAKRIA
jgi:hypothetical protein